MLLINEFRGLFASCNSINMNINAIYYFTKRSLLTTPLKSFLVCLFSFLHDYKKCNLLSSLEFSVAFCVRIQTTLTDFLSSFSVLVLYQYILVYNYFVSCPFICGHISILAFSFMQSHVSPIVPLQPNIHYHRVQAEYSSTIKLICNEEIVNT